MQSNITARGVVGNLEKSCCTLTHVCFGVMIPYLLKFRPLRLGIKR